MFIQIPDILDKDQIKTVTKALDKAKFMDGKTTVVGPAAAAKNNLQMDREKSGPLGLSGNHVDQRSRRPFINDG